MDPGLQFTGTPSFHAPLPPGPPNFFSYRLRYDVRVQTGGLSITDASLTMPAPILTADGSLTITELICLGAVFESKGICANSAPMVTLNTFDTPTGAQLMATTTFAPQRLVGTETLLIADLGTKGWASLGSFTEQYSELPPRVVAEPASFTLPTCVIAMLASGVGRRRRG